MIDHHQKFLAVNYTQVLFSRKMCNDVKKTT